MDEFEAHLGAVARTVDGRLQALLSDEVRAGEIARPARLLAAMRHAVLAGGKRFRPFLLIAAAEMFGGGPSGGDRLAAAAAVELLHTYSLVHDDLPSMDDDDLRRGSPTVHRAFDEATAILAGDGLQTLAFQVLAEPATHPDPAVRSALVLDLALASGAGGMGGGQMLDLAAEGRFADGRPLALGEAEIRRLQAMKTGALIKAACVMGGRFAGASGSDLAVLGRYGEIVGLAFQLADDLLDVTADAAAMGKATAKDAAAGKSTLVGLKGVGPVRAELADLVREAADLLAPYGERGRILAEAARFSAERSH